MVRANGGWLIRVSAWFDYMLVRVRQRLEPGKRSEFLLFLLLTASLTVTAYANGDDCGSGMAPFDQPALDSFNLEKHVNAERTLVEEASREQTLVKSPHGFWLAPSPWNGTLYGANVTNANWYFTQWHNPGRKFQPFAGHSTATRSGRLIDLGGQWEIAQSGYNLPPDTEFSVFASPIRADIYPSHPPAISTSGPLSEMEYLHHTIGFMPKHERMVAEVDQNHGGYLSAIVLKNTEAGDSLYYQLALRSINRRPHHGWWQWSGPRWGYCDTILNFEESIAAVGERKFYHLDLLPRLKKILRNAANGVDSDPSHWVVVGAYHGSHIWGDVRLTGVWDSYSLRVRYKQM